MSDLMEDDIFQEAVGKIPDRGIKSDIPFRRKAGSPFGFHRPEGNQMGSLLSGEKEYHF
jgi:hypothetical protein